LSAGDEDALVDVVCPFAISGNSKTAAARAAFLDQFMSVPLISGTDTLSHLGRRAINIHTAMGALMAGWA
jgi:hypothetical protein